MFSKAFVINLPFKTDRLESFLKRVPACFGQIEVWPAVHGDSIRHPDWWTSGAGAWGCYRSHLQILEHCYQNQIESYVVFEDDAIFRPNADEATKLFLDAVPPDWEMIYLGGQLLHEVRNPPRKINDQVYTPYNVNRTHCFAVHQRGYDKIYRHLFGKLHPNEHIDHHLGRLHESGTLKLYAPARWIVGQDGGPSNISGNTNAATFWIDPEILSDDKRDWKHPSIPAVFLESSLDVAIELERRGWHRGHWQSTERLDNGVCHAVASVDCKTGLAEWYKTVLPEAVREGKSCVCLYHPILSWDFVKTLDQNYEHVVATTTDDAQHQFARILSEQQQPHDARAIRHLIYHIYPRRGNGVWKWNVEQLLKRIEQFDGIRSIGVVTDDDSDSRAGIFRWRVPVC